MTAKWDELASINCKLEDEELVLRNTFVNAQMGPLAEFARELF